MIISFIKKMVFLMEIVSLNKRGDYDTIQQYGETLCGKYKEFLKKDNIGISLDKRQINAYILGKGKTRLIISAGIHGRESVNTTAIMRIIEEICVCLYDEKSSIPCFGNSARLKNRLFSGSIVFVPLVNPDGYEIAIKDVNVIRDESLKEIVNSYIKRHDYDYRKYKKNAMCIDINRDFFSRAPQPETTALIKVFKNYPCKYFIDFHSRGNSIYYHRNAMGKLYNIRQKIIAKSLSKYNGYSLMNPEEEIEKGDIGGNSVHYFSQICKGHSFTIETVNEHANFPIDEAFIREVFAMNCYIPLSFI